VITLHCRPPGERPTEILVGDGAAASLPARAARRSVFALVDERAAAAAAALVDPGWTALRVPAGEDLKTLSRAEAVLRAMAGAGLDRTSLLVAIGGGTVSDLGGLCAALFLRGIEFWVVPTTLLAMVDSAVGGKNAVNLPEGKNLVGTVHPPALVAADPALLSGLPPAELRSGLAEAIKVAIGLDAALFERLETEAAAIQQGQAAALLPVVHRCLAAKVAVVAADLREDGPRRLLNLGHTLGHALEARAGGALPHGLAVARGLHFALDVAADLRAIAPADADRCRRLLAAYGHARDPLPPLAELLPFLRRDKKVAGQAIAFVVPTGIGRSDVRTMPLRELERRLQAQTAASEAPGGT
jgi:3-dehydroquinate synthase